MSRKRRRALGAPAISSTSAGENITDGSAPSASLSRSGIVAVEAHALALARALEADADLVAAIRVDRARRCEMPSAPKRTRS